MTDKHPRDLEWKDISNALVTRIRSRLEAQGLSAHAASSQAGLAKDAIRDIERGREPGISKMIKLAKALDCDLNYFDTTMPAGDAPETVAIRAAMDNLLEHHAADGLAAALVEASRRLDGTGLPQSSVARLAVELFLGQMRNQLEQVVRQ